MQKKTREELLPGRGWYLPGDVTVQRAPDAESGKGARCPSGGAGGRGQRLESKGRRSKEGYRVG